MWLYGLSYLEYYSIILIFVSIYSKLILLAYVIMGLVGSVLH